mmetsp:Transcript_12810/g.15308  ORF Transcript_12810/g.15308 Transcript_12810/m.15308 type:complete len:255 (-) Transcript_12810:165-929(-)
MAAQHRKADEDWMDVRKKSWFRPYYATIEKDINNIASKNSFKNGGELKIFGIAGCPKYSKSTKYEWTALLEDLDAAINKGSLHFRPTCSRIEFEELDELVGEWVSRPGKNRFAIIASCPSQIGDDTTIMDQVIKAMADYDNVHIMFATQGDGVSTLYEKASVSQAIEAAEPHQPTCNIDALTGNWTVYWENGTSYANTVSHGCFTTYGDNYQLKNTSPVSFVWPDGTQQSVTAFDGNTVVWKTSGGDKIKWVRA